MSTPSSQTPYTTDSSSLRSKVNDLSAPEKLLTYNNARSYSSISSPGLSSPSSSSGSPSYDVVRRQPSRGANLKLFTFRFHNLSNDFEFAGWGSISYLRLSPDQINEGGKDVEDEKCNPLLGPWMASAVAANEVFGSVFYAFPAVVLVSGVFSPISLLIATLSLFLWRPIIEELASAFSRSGSNYTYLVNSTTKSIALAAGAFALLDFAITITVSAATASAYIAGEYPLPFPIYVGTILILVTPVMISLSGLRESARVATGIMAFHLLTMVVLLVVSSVAWIRRGNGQIRENWINGQPSNGAELGRQIFDGVCLGILGLTGFECSPDYSCTVSPSHFPNVLRNMHLPTIALYAPLILVVFAILPTEAIIGGSNVLSALAESAAGRWMRIWVVVDASIVLSAGVLTGIFSACALCEQLSRDRVLPKLFLYRLPKTGAQVVAIGTIVLLSMGLYATTAASLQVVSKVFAMTWLSVMTLFPISLLLLKFNRGRIPRTRRATLPLVVITLLFSIAAIGGNVALDPSTIGYFSAYAISIMMFFFISANRSRIIREIYWVYDQTPALHNMRWMKRWEGRLKGWFKGMRKQPVAVCVKEDAIHQLFQMISYVSKNEETTSVKLVHFYEEDKPIPSELEANAKLIDEAFPEITVDLVFVQAPFTPATVAALSRQLDIPRSLMFMACPGEKFKCSLAELGMRIICL